MYFRRNLCLKRCSSIRLDQETYKNSSTVKNLFTLKFKIIYLNSLSEKYNRATSSTLIFNLVDFRHFLLLISIAKITVK